MYLMLALHEVGQLKPEADALLLRGLLQVGHRQIQLAEAVDDVVGRLLSRLRLSNPCPIHIQHHLCRACKLTCPAYSPLQWTPQVDFCQSLVSMVCLPSRVAQASEGQHAM